METNNAKMKIEYFHASNYGNGAMPAESLPLRRQGKDEKSRRRPFVSPCF